MQYTPCCPGTKHTLRRSKRRSYMFSRYHDMLRVRTLCSRTSLLIECAGTTSTLYVNNLQRTHLDSLYSSFPRLRRLPSLIDICSRRVTVLTGICIWLRIRIYKKILVILVGKLWTFYLQPADLFVI